MNTLVNSTSPASTPIDCGNHNNKSNPQNNMFEDTDPEIEYYDEDLFRDLKKLYGEDFYHNEVDDDHCDHEDEDWEDEDE
ncbi:MAG: hypothetical protein NZM04_09315 [Methylacidiphilales bacterium]|nr:hypothetical protein [Candidatus Methylacidiphilales bacterium]